MSAQICIECGDDDATEGHLLCLDCLEETYVSRETRSG
jgi:NMD protein affecting ribosome stability and mRNA decay